MIGFFMENEVKIQKDYEILKKKADLTEKFVRLVDKIEIDDKEVPKTEKGLETKAKELMDRLAKKLEKEELQETPKNKKERNKRKY